MGVENEAVGAAVIVVAFGVDDALAGASVAEGIAVAVAAGSAFPLSGACGAAAGLVVDVSLLPAACSRILDLVGVLMVRMSRRRGEYLPMMAADNFVSVSFLLLAWLFVRDVRYRFVFWEMSVEGTPGDARKTSASQRGW